MRRRARHRLIGAGVLVLIGVVGFPLLFDTQPRPVAVDIPIEIPDRNKVKPLRRAGRSQPRQPRRRCQRRRRAAARAEQSGCSSQPKAEPKPKPARAKPSQAGTQARAQARTQGRSQARKPRRDDGAKAQALLDGKPVDRSRRCRAAASWSRWAPSPTPTRPARRGRRWRRAGLKTYTNVAETKDGKRIRVRVGPFAHARRSRQGGRQDQGPGFAGRHPHLVGQAPMAALDWMFLAVLAAVAAAGRLARAGVRGVVGDQLGGGVHPGPVVRAAGGGDAADGRRGARRCAMRRASCWCSSPWCSPAGCWPGSSRSWSKPWGCGRWTASLGAAFGLMRGAVLLLALAVVINMSPLKRAAWWTRIEGRRCCDGGAARD